MDKWVTLVAGYGRYLGVCRQLATVIAGWAPPHRQVTDYVLYSLYNFELQRPDSHYQLWGADKYKTCHTKSVNFEEKPTSDYLALMLC